MGRFIPILSRSIDHLRVQESLEDRLEGRSGGMGGASGSAAPRNRTDRRCPFRSKDLLIQLLAGGSRLGQSWRRGQKIQVREDAADDLGIGEKYQNRQNFNVTSNLAGVWMAQQLVEAFPWQDPPKYLLRDRDKIYGQIPR